ncbi:MAG: VIT1/CCC1 family protein [Synergistaceae bacterium]|jgi:VIT1/CCC1 family predicted Fe2+/Mn2+ transporter|nr:VIT1/CCC1 family protein [Synergistaceae bacterium]
MSKEQTGQRGQNSGQAEGRRNGIAAPLQLLLQFQQAEIDGTALYASLSKSARNERNKSLTLSIAEDEARHAQIFKAYTNTILSPNCLKVAYYVLLSKIFGFSFCIRLFERSENDLSERYAKNIGCIPELAQIMEDEKGHEELLVAMLDEEWTRSAGSAALGLSGALVGLTGSLAGCTAAFCDTRLVAAVGAITGLSAVLSATASDYLSGRAEKRENQLKSSICMGFARLLTAALLILPYVFLKRQNYAAALSLTLTTAAGIVAVFNGYGSIVLGRPFRRGFLEMSYLAVGLCAVSFVLGVLVKHVLKTV